MVRKIEGFHKKQVQGGINTFRSKLPPLHSKTIFYAKIDLCPNIPTAKVSALSLLFVLPPSSLLVATVQCQECQYRSGAAEVGAQGAQLRTHYLAK